MLFGTSKDHTGRPKLLKICYIFVSFFGRFRITICAFCGFSSLFLAIWLSLPSFPITSFYRYSPLVIMLHLFICICISLCLLCILLVISHLMFFPPVSSFFVELDIHKCYWSAVAHNQFVSSVINPWNYQAHYLLYILSHAWEWGGGAVRFACRFGFRYRHWP